MGEERDESEEGHRILGGSGLLVIYVKDIAQALEGIETDSDRQDYVERIES